MLESQIEDKEIGQSMMTSATCAACTFSQAGCPVRICLLAATSTHKPPNKHKFTPFTQLFLFHTSISNKRVKIRFENISEFNSIEIAPFIPFRRV